MSADRRLRRFIIWISFGAAALLLAWTALLIVTGGFDHRILGVRIRTNDWFKPLLDAGIALTVFLLAGGEVPRWFRVTVATVRSLPARIAAMDAGHQPGGRRRLMRIGAVATIAIAAAVTFSRPRLMPVHDTSQVFDAFYYFYSHIVTHHALPHWAPYGVYGVPFAPWSLIAISPSNYLAAAIGWMFQIHDVLTVFTLSVLFELLMFAFGFVALLIRLGQRPSVAWITACALVIGTCWSTQLWWNFRIIYLLPAVLFFLTRFMQEGRITDLCLGALAEAAGMIGNLGYFAPLHMLIAGLAGALLAVRYRRTLRLARPASLWPVIVLGIWALVAVAGWALLTRATMQPLVPPKGHNQGDMSVPLDMYLTFAINGSLGDTIRMLVRGWPLFVQTFPDNSVYLGPFTIFFLAWGAAFVRHRFGFRLTGALGLFVLWLSFAGMLALLMYFVPGFNMFRHLGLLLFAAQAFLVAAGAFGLEHFLASARAKHVWWLLAAIWILFDATLTPDPNQMVEFHQYWVWGAISSPTAQLLWRAELASLILLGVLLIASGLRRWPWQQPLGGLAWIVVIAWVVDLSSFGAFRTTQLPTLSVADEVTFASTLQVRRPEYSERRTSWDTAAINAQTLLDHAHAQLESMRTTVFGRGSLELWALSDLCGGIEEETFVLNTTAAAVRAAERHEAPLLDAIMKCEAPKLRLVSASALKSGAPETAAQSVSGDVRVERYTGNDLAANVKADTAGMLLYADAVTPDWRVFVDGARQPMIAAFGAFKAVALDAGSHHVEFRFVPAFWLTGVEWLTLSGVAVILLLAILAVHSLINS